jgi:hypothetical protein
MHVLGALVAVKDRGCAVPSQYVQDTLDDHAELYPAVLSTSGVRPLLCLPCLLIRRPRLAQRPEHCVKTVRVSFDDQSACAFDKKGNHNCSSTTT